VFPAKKRVSHEKEVGVTQNYVGEVRLFGGNFAPYGWHYCDGSLLSISQYSTLYNLIGTTYGGDGVNTFGLPDLRGRCGVHQGTGPGLSTYLMGQLLGLEDVTLTINQMPSHPHSFSGTNTATGGNANPGTTVALGPAPTGDNIYDGTGGATTLSPGTAVTMAGGSLPHNNRQQYLAISYIIALEGIYPSQS
jgi:microcystin-dependent protein